MDRRINETVDRLRDMLLKKNASYGNSALEPVRIFSHCDPTEQIRTRIDDKLSRLIKGHEMANEDTYIDLWGYLTLLIIAEDIKPRIADDVAEAMVRRR